MPSVRDFSKDDEADQLAQRGGGISGGGGPSQAQSQPQREEAFTPWSRFVSANADVSQREAGKLASGVQGDVDAAVKGRDDASAAQSSAIAQNYTGGGRSTQPSRPFADTAARSAQPAESSFGNVGGSFGAPDATPQTISNRPTQASQQGPLSMATLPAASMLPITGKPIKGPPTAPAAPAIDPDRLQTDLTGGMPKTSGVGLTGGKDLEAQLGAPAWSKLVGDTAKAGAEASALGSTPGVQSLIQNSGAPSPNSAFDAALIGGAGGKQFRDISKQYGGDALGKGLLGANESAQGAWQKLMGDVQDAAGARDASITGANAEMGRLAAEQAANELPPEAKQKAAESKSWLEEHFPVPEQFQSKDGFTQWIQDNRNGPNGANSQQGGYSNLKAWAEQIYGEGSQANVDQFFADIRRMTDAEYAAFMYGMVPEWMGLGGKAAGYNGGKFYGLGNTGNRYTAETTGKATAENQKFWSEWRAGLETFYQVLAAVAAAAATATGGPVVGAAVSAGLQAALAGEKAASNGGKQLGEDDNG